MGRGDRKHRKHKKKKKKNYNPTKKRNEAVIKDFKTTLKKDLKNNSRNNEPTGRSFKKEDEKVSYEIVNERLTYDEKNPVHFLKWTAKYDELDGTKVKDMTDFDNVFAFAVSNDNNDRRLKNSKNTEFAFAWFKSKIKSSKPYEIPLDGNTHSNLDITNFSGIIKKDKLQEFVPNLIPYSFILQAKIEFKSPYFSKDDDNFYLIQNPCLKEKVFKVPMVRGSGWKGAIASAFRKIINESNNKKETLRSFMRIFGTGSNEFRELQKGIEKSLKENTSLNPDKLITYVLFELGLKLTKDDIDKIKTNPEKWIKENLWESFEKGSKKELPLYLTTHRGRAIFYPTYFNKLSLEIINPHDRKKRAGTNPIHYEVVPEGAEGTLQIIYIPFDGVLMESQDLKEQVENDIKFLNKCIEKVSDIGVGAKTKLGWGRFELITKKIECNKNDITIPERWNDE